MPFSGAAAQKRVAESAGAIDMRHQMERPTKGLQGENVKRDAQASTGRRVLPRVYGSLSVRLCIPYEGWEAGATGWHYAGLFPLLNREVGPGCSPAQPGKAA